MPVIFGVPVKMAMLYMKAVDQSEINTSSGGVDSIVKGKLGWEFGLIAGSKMMKP